MNSFAFTPARLLRPLLAVLLASCFFAPDAARAQLQTVASFSGYSDKKGSHRGQGPVGLILASDGNFYGTTEGGGANNRGTVYRMTPDGKVTTLVEFTGDDGAVPGDSPTGGLVQGRDGLLYGTLPAIRGAVTGSIYSVSLSGQYTSVAPITIAHIVGAMGCGDTGGLVLGNDGNLYGATSGGVANDAGTVYRYTPGGGVTDLYDFSPGTGDGAMSNPRGRLCQARDGNFYGVTSGGGYGDPDGGAIYRLTPGGKVSIFASFRQGSSGKHAGWHPLKGLMQASDGNFYGAATKGGAFGYGTIYRVTPDGKVSALYSFERKTGDFPTEPPTEGPDGALYGTTPRGGWSGDGMVYRLTKSGDFTTLFTYSGFRGAFPGLIPSSSFLLMSDGSFYGTNERGGNEDCGAVIRLKVTPAMLSGPTIPGPAASP